MVIYINYRYTLFRRDDTTQICGGTTFETLHKVWNEIKLNEKSVYSNIGGLSHVHLSLVLTDGQYYLILNTPFPYPTRPGPLIILDGMTSHMNSNMRITHTKEVCLFRKGDRIRANPHPTNCIHGQGGLSCGHPRSNHIFDQLHCCRCLNTSARQLRSVIVTRTPWAHRNFQEDKLSSPWTDRVRLFHLQRTLRVRWYRRNILHPASFRQHHLCGHPQYGQVFIINSQI